MTWQKPQIRAPPTAFSDITDLFSEATILSDAPDGLLENHPAFSTPIRPPIEQDIIQEDYNEGEWQDIDNNIDNPTTDFSSESLSANAIWIRATRSSSDISVRLSVRLDELICLLIALFKLARFFHQTAFRAIFRCLIDLKLER
ncbi:hypothetical protein V8E54_003155 [Elaphomyces granulatus]